MKLKNQPFFQNRKKRKVFLPVFLILCFVFVVTATIIDEGQRSRGDYGYNATDRSFLSNGIRYENTDNGLIRFRDSDGEVGTMGFAISGTIAGNNYRTDVREFTWTWSIENTRGENYTVTAYNNKPRFNWTQVWSFSPDSSPKVKHILTNNFREITNTKFWYIHTLREDTWINYDDKTYSASNERPIHIKGNLNNRIPLLNFGFDYFFNFQDLIDNKFTISNVYIGNGSVIGADGLFIGAVGVTKGDSIFSVGQTITLDPIIDVNGLNFGTQMSNGENIVRNSEGELFAVYTNASNSIIFANSTGFGLSWTKKAILLYSLGSASNSVSISIRPDDTIDIVWSQWISTPKYINWVNSTDGGVTLSTPMNIMQDPGGKNLYRPECKSDSTGFLHCCATATNTEAFYVNTSSFGSAITLSDRSLTCDVTIDNDNLAYMIKADILGTQRTITLLRSDELDNPAGNRHTVAKYSDTNIAQAVSACINEDNNIFITYINNSRLFLSYSNTTDLDNWREVQLDTDTSMLSEIACSTKHLNIFYGDSISQNGVFISNVSLSENISDVSKWSIRRVGASDGTSTTQADSRWGGNNKMDNKTRAVWGSPLGFNGESTLYEEFDVPFSSCTYGDGGEEFRFEKDWNITEHCLIVNESITVLPFDLNINATGSLNLTGTSNVTANQIRFPNVTGEYLRLESQCFVAVSK